MRFEVFPSKRIRKEAVWLAALLCLHAVALADIRLPAVFANFKTIRTQLLRSLLIFVSITLALSCFCSAAENDALSMPEDYYAEPVGLPFDEVILEEKAEAGWRWTEFRYTSLIYNGEPIRVRAIFAVPDQADDGRKVPLIIATHGGFGAVRPVFEGHKADARYWETVSALAKAGYAVLFFDWEPMFAIQAAASGEPLPENPRFTTYGNMDYSTKDRWMLPGNDFKDSVYYQVMMAGKRAITWAGAQPEVDASRIGAWGPSFGGIFSSLLAAIDPRITAVNPVVYTARFGQDEESYNRLPAEWSQEQAHAFRARFDSELLLRDRRIPVLYTVSTNDRPFSVLKASECFATMSEPKHLLISPNEGHGFWDLRQTLLFFDYALRGIGERPRIGPLLAEARDSKIAAAITTNGEMVDFYFTAEAPKPDVPEREHQHPSAWVWERVVGVQGADGKFHGEWEPSAHAPQPLERIHVFASVSGVGDVVECSPITTVRP